MVVFSMDKREEVKIFVHCHNFPIGRRHIIAMNKDPSNALGKNPSTQWPGTGASISLAQPGPSFSRAGRSIVIRSTTELRADSLPGNSSVKLAYQRQQSESNRSAAAASETCVIATGNPPPPATTPVLSTLDVASYNQSRKNAEGSDGKNIVSMIPLDINSLGMNGVADIKPTPLVEAIVASSPRLHPSVHHQQQQQFVVGKQSLFNDSLHTLIKRPMLPEDSLAGGGGDSEAKSQQRKHHNEMGGGERGTPGPGDRPLSSPLKLRRTEPSRGTSAFLSPDRESATKSTMQANPPVGHYHPLFTAVELPLAKPAIFPKSKLASHHTTTTNAAMGLLQMTHHHRNHPKHHRKIREPHAAEMPSRDASAAISPIRTIVNIVNSPLMKAARSKRQERLQGGDDDSSAYLSGAMTDNDVSHGHIVEEGLAATTGGGSPPPPATTPSISTQIAFGRGRSAANGKGAPALSKAEERVETQRELQTAMDQWVPVKPFEKVIVTSQMGKETGRRDDVRSVSADLIYDQRVPDCLSTVHINQAQSFHKRTGRDAPTCGRAASVGPEWGSGKPPRTGADLESVRPPVSLDAYITNHYKRDPCITFFSKQPSRDVATNDFIKTRLRQNVGRSELPSNLDGRYSSSGMYGGVDMFDVSASSRTKRKELERSITTLDGSLSTLQRQAEGGSATTRRLIGHLYKGANGMDPSLIRKVPDFAKTEGRKPQPLLPGQGLMYDVSYEAQDLHIPLTKLPPRAQSSSSDILVKRPANSLDTTPIAEVDQLRRKLVQNVTFSNSVSREQREMIGRNAAHMIANVSSVDEHASLDELAVPVHLRRAVKGAVEFVKGTDRDTRNRAGHNGASPQSISPSRNGGKRLGDEGSDGSATAAVRLLRQGGVAAKCANDLVYTYDVDKFKGPLNKGAVEFGKMTSRETHKAAVHDRPSMRIR